MHMLTNEKKTNYDYTKLAQYNLSAKTHPQRLSVY